MTRSWWGWGELEAAVTDAELDEVAAPLRAAFGIDQAPSEPVDPALLRLPPSRVAVPTALEHLVDADPRERYRHAHGNAFRDVIRALHGELLTMPDLVLRPRDAAEVEAVLGWCADVGVVCIPFGGGTSVVGGVNPPGDPSISLDLEGLGGVLEVDPVSSAARVGAGTLGPAIDDELRPAGLTLRHFPQSWEFSTLGGWIVTRAAGHFATGPTRIDDLVESISAVTPAGRWESRRLPASGAGPSPDRLLLGSEGTLGVVTDAWVRVRSRPQFRGQATARFDTFDAGLAAVRALAGSGLQPANCRLLDPVEATIAGAGEGTTLILGFESADHAVGPELDRGVELVGDHGGAVTTGPVLREGDETGTAEGGSGAWRRTFLRAPYLRDALVRLGAVVETFETALTWDVLPDAVATIRDAAADTARRICGGALVGVRLTHAYPDGAAPYLTVIAPGRRGAEVAMWDEIKAAAAEAVLASGGTITHHHAVGRDHRPWYDRQRPDRFALAFGAAKAALDPAGILNPGVLLDPR